MTPTEFRREVQANNFAVLYECRWSAEQAGEVVPVLISLLSHGMPRVVQDSLRALRRIGPAAYSATPRVQQLLGSEDLLTKRLAVSTLGMIALQDPGLAVPALVASAVDERVLVDALHALLLFRKAGAAAAPFFNDCYASRDAKVRRLAVRGLRYVDATDERSCQTIALAQHDRNAEVRHAARGHM